MKPTILVNSCRVVHKGSCVKSSATSYGSKKVRTGGRMPKVIDTISVISGGDEAGAFVSSETMRECSYRIYSLNVKIEGKKVCRLGDPVVQK